MPRVCTVCTHPDRSAIDHTLVAGGALRNIAKRFGTSATALHRHKAGHLPAKLAKAKEAAEVAHADDLLVHVREMQSRTLAILGSAESAGELRTALAAIREARGNLELLAKLLGELDESPTVNVTVSTEWVTIRTAVMKALGPYPEARTAVAGELLELEAG